jgi:histidine ammonia-lyase
MSRLGRYVAAVELYVAAQAVDLRDRSGELGEGTRRVYELVRAHAPRPLPGEPPLADLGPLEEALATPGSDPERRP